MMSLFEFYIMMSALTYLCGMAGLIWGVAPVNAPTGARILWVGIMGVIFIPCSLLWPLFLLSSTFCDADKAVEKVW